MSIPEFDELYKKYERELYAFIYSIARRDSFAAEDILQNTMLNVYKYIQTLHEKEKLKAWVFAIAKREASRYYSKKEFDMEVQTYNLENVIAFEPETLLEPDFSLEFISAEAFVSAISELNTNEQSVIFLRYKFGFKLQEIADVWNMNNNTVKTIHFRAIRELKKSFAGKGYGLDKEG